MALRLACQQAICTIIHTDYVREVLRTCMQPSEGSPLMKVSHNAWELLGESSTENILKGFILHVDAVAPALLAIARKLSRDGLDAIMEGVHCYGAVLDQLAQVDGLMVCPRLLVVSSEAGLLDHIQRKEAQRSAAGEAKVWKTHVKTLRSLQDFLLQEAIQRHIPLIYTEEGVKHEQW